jgi:hypothetical protein
MVLNFGLIVRFVQMVFSALRCVSWLIPPGFELGEFAVLGFASLLRLSRFLLSLALCQESEESGEPVGLLIGSHSVLSTFVGTGLSSRYRA